MSFADDAYVVGPELVYQPHGDQTTAKAIEIAWGIVKDGPRRFDETRQAQKVGELAAVILSSMEERAEELRQDALGKADDKFGNSPARARGDES